MIPSAARSGSALIRGTLSMLLAEALILPTGFITAVFLARGLGPGNYGLFALASSVIVFLEWACTSIFSTTSVKFIGESSDWRPVGTTVARFYLIMGVFAGTALWFCAPLLAKIFNEPDMAGYLRLFAIDIPISSLASANCNVLVGTGRFQKRALITACRLLVRLALIVLFVEMGLSVYGAIMGIIGASVAELAVSWFYVRPSLYPASSFPKRRLLSFGAPLFLTSISLRFFRMDLFALKVLGGSAAWAGFYGAALNLSIPPTLLSISLSSPLLSTLSGLLGGGRDSSAKEIVDTALRSLFWLLPFAAMTAGAAPEIVSFVYGNSFLPAGSLLGLLMFAGVGMHAISVSVAILTAAGKTRMVFALTGPLIPLSFLSYIVLVPSYGGMGAAIVVVTGAWCSALALIIAAGRVWDTPWPISDVVKCSLCSVLAFLITRLWPVAGVLVVAKLVIISGVIMLAFLSLRLFSAREIAVLRSLFQLRYRANTKGTEEV